MAHKKAGGSSRNGRDSAGRRLGVKLFGGQAAIAGNIMDLANAPGEPIGPGELGKALEMVAAGTDIDYDADGYVVGLGAEKMLSDRMSVTGEYEYSDFGTTEVDVTTGGVYTNATPSFHNLKVGVNFKF